MVRGTGIAATAMSGSVPGGLRAGETAEHRAGGEPGSARVVEVEQPADKLTAGEQARDRMPSSASTFAVRASMARPPNVNVMPQVIM